MKILFAVLLIVFTHLIVASFFINVAQTRRRKKNVAEFLSKCDEKQLEFIRQYDECYKVGLRDLCKKKKKSK